ncbi:hypothetical protein CDAR_301531 [Caerostris darwini]|uniref:MADF domain-containing protein n=1 Tax=Caerostris darwini TaxID=1538125 RepID=A0AAV4TUM3_9ARAC|nr:hypothetical protein CDAR_301531 [Caerostris darwini]
MSFLELYLHTKSSWSNLLSQDEKDVQQESCERSLVETADNCKDRFKYLRDKYRKVKNLMNLPSGSNSRIKKTMAIGVCCSILLIAHSQDRVNPSLPSKLCLHISPLYRSTLRGPPSQHNRHPLNPITTIYFFRIDLLCSEILSASEIFFLRAAVMNGYDLE